MPKPKSDDPEVWDHYYEMRLQQLHNVIKEAQLDRSSLRRICANRK